MSGWNLPPGCSLNDIDRLFEDEEFSEESTYPNEIDVDVEERWIPTAQEQWMLDEIALPTPFESGTCRCGVFVEAGLLWAHTCQKGI
jgi:hypothetical protein